ncbi:MAG: DUF2577 domain-containing protein [Lachnospirales bacterium]
MGEYSQFNNAIKQIALSVIDSNKPVNVVYGKVTKVSPLEITVDSKLILTEKFLVLCREVTEYEVDMTVDHLTEHRAGGGGDAEFESHNHAYKGRKTFLVHKGLLVGEEVVMIREQEGQRFLVIDRKGAL